jgi:hypothetical protein
MVMSRREASSSGVANVVDGMRLSFEYSSDRRCTRSTIRPSIVTVATSKCLDYPLRATTVS